SQHNPRNSAKNHPVGAGQSPEGLLPRLIVRTYVLSNGEPRWRSGVILRFEGNRALVAGDAVERRVRVRIAGPAAGWRRLLAVVRNDFDRIHAGYKFQPQAMVPVPSHPDVVVPYSKLLTLERAGMASYVEVAGDEVLELDVRALLDGVDLEGTRPSSAATERAVPALLGLVSYSHRDDDLRAELETHLKLLQRQRLLQLWTDRRITAGEEWKGQIDTNMERADLILLLISPDFMDSDYCWDIELKRALERHEAGLARVIPIIVRDVNWRSAPFAKLQALPKDGKAVTTWGNDRYARDTAWKSVAEGVEQALRELSASGGH
ncbi:MAG TPA: TIR domain-containing protein, partial [Geminicoccaceae bacterium]|nr:TIR domain-containing protein [Geminicoccaceae bacterium]